MDTPRTDAETFKLQRGLAVVSVVYSAFARTLECELAQAKAENQRLAEQVKGWMLNEEIARANGRELAEELRLAKSLCDDFEREKKQVFADLAQAKAQLAQARNVAREESDIRHRQVSALRAQVDALTSKVDELVLDLSTSSEDNENKLRAENARLTTALAAAENTIDQIRQVLTKDRTESERIVWALQIIAKNKRRAR